MKRLDSTDALNLYIEARRLEEKLERLVRPTGRYSDDRLQRAQASAFERSDRRLAFARALADSEDRCRASRLSARSVHAIRREIVGKHPYRTWLNEQTDADPTLAQAA